MVLHKRYSRIKGHSRYTETSFHNTTATENRPLYGNSFSSRCRAHQALSHPVPAAPLPARAQPGRCGEEGGKEPARLRARGHPRRRAPTSPAAAPSLFHAPLRPRAGGRAGGRRRSRGPAANPGERGAQSRPPPPLGQRSRHPRQRGRGGGERARRKRERGGGEGRADTSPPPSPAAPSLSNDPASPEERGRRGAPSPTARGRAEPPALSPRPSPAGLPSPTASGTRP